MHIFLQAGGTGSDVQILQASCDNTLLDNSEGKWIASWKGTLPAFSEIDNNAWERGRH